jgi:hypothetical protein
MLTNLDELNNSLTAAQQALQAASDSGNYDDAPENLLDNTLLLLQKAQNDLLLQSEQDVLDALKTTNDDLQTLSCQMADCAKKLDDISGTINKVSSIVGTVVTVIGTVVSAGIL